MENKSISPLYQKLILKNLANSCSTTIGNDLYYFIKAIRLMNSHLGKDFVKKEWERLGNNYEKTIKNIQKLEKKSVEAKSYYDALEDKKFEKKDKELKIKKFYLKTASKIPALNQELYDFFVFLSMQTPIHRQTIPSDFWKIIEHTGRKPIELGDKKIIPQTNATQN